MVLRRAPYGARGLKFSRLVSLAGRSWSRPVWGAWIEIYLAGGVLSGVLVAPRMGRVD